MIRRIDIVTFAVCWSSPDRTCFLYPWCLKSNLAWLRDRVELERTTLSGRRPLTGQRLLPEGNHRKLMTGHGTLKAVVSGKWFVSWMSQISNLNFSVPNRSSLLLEALILSNKLHTEELVSCSAAVQRVSSPVCIGRPDSSSLHFAAYNLL